MLPLPFGKGVVVWAEPVEIDADADKATLEAARATLEARMIAANMEADLACRGEAVTAAPKPGRDKDAA